MATAEIRRAKKADAHDHGPPRKKRFNAFRLGCWLTVVVLLLATALAPWIVSYTPVADWIVAEVLQVDGSVSIGSLSLGWFANVTAENLEIRDAAGEPLLEVASLRGEKSLISILLDIDDLGLIHVDSPKLHVIAGQDDTNLERALAKLLSRPRNARFATRLQVSGGVISLEDTVTSRQYQVENLNADCALGSTAAGIALTAEGTIAAGIALTAEGTIAAGRRLGTFKLDLQTQPDNASAVASGKLHCQAEALPLDVVATLLRRTVKGARLSGQLSTELAGAWGALAEGGQATVQGTSSATEVVFSCDALGQDRIALPRIELPCHLIEREGQVQVEQLAVNSDLGNLALTGSFSLGDFSADHVLAALARENYQIQGHLDLAQVARLLPETLRIREEIQITSGQLEVTLASQRQKDTATWSGSVAADHLRARSGGRTIAWEQPLALEFASHAEQNQLIVDHAKCDSEFLQVTAAGSSDNFTASATFDLARLAEQLRQFADLDSVNVSGAGRAHLAWKRVDERGFVANTDFAVQKFQYVVGQGRAWQEDQLVAKADLRGQLEAGRLASVETAHLAIAAGGERLEAQLQQGIANPTTAEWPLVCSWQGPLGPWAARLEMCLGIKSWNLTGVGAAEALVTATQKEIKFDEVKASGTRLRAWGPGWFIDEPTVSLVGAGRWDRAAHDIHIAQARVSAGSSVAAVDGASLKSTRSGWTLDGGTAKFDGDLAQLYRWRHDPRTAANWRIVGHLAGQAALGHAQGLTSGQLDGTIEGLQVVDLSRATGPGAAPAAWQERRLTLAGRGVYRHDDGQLQLDTLKISSDALACEARGATALSSAGGDVDLQGTVQYDWQQLAPLWKPYLGEGISIVGRQARPFALRGKLRGDPTVADSWKDVQGEAAVGWTTAEVYGVQLGVVEIATQIAAGQARAKPLDVAVGDGRFRLAPVLRFSPAPAELFLSRGPVLTNLRLSPAMCARGLKFVAPILSEVTVADGTFSIDLDGGRLPVSDPSLGDVAGRMAMRAQVKAGPILQEFMVVVRELTTVLARGSLANLDDQSGALVSINDANVEFRMVNGRVYHRGMTFLVGTLPVSTQGSVGFDESLAIIAEVPIQARLFGRDLSFGALEGQTIQIPIEGTLRKPKLDRRIVEQFAERLLQNVARGAIVEEVKNALEQLLPLPR